MLTRLESPVNECAAQMIWLDSDWEVIGRESDENLESKVAPENLAYVIFTSSAIFSVFSSIRQTCSGPAETESDVACSLIGSVQASTLSYSMKFDLSD